MPKTIVWINFLAPFLLLFQMVSSHICSTPAERPLKQNWRKCQIVRLIFSEWQVGLFRIALLLYPPPTRPLGPLPDPYPIHTGQRIKYKSLFQYKNPKNLEKKSEFLVAMRAIESLTITVFLPMKSHCEKILTWENTVYFRISYY